MRLWFSRLSCERLFDPFEVGLPCLKVAPRLFGGFDKVGRYRIEGKE